MSRKVDTPEAVLKALAKIAPRIADALESLEQENARLRAWVADLQAGVYVNCVYCGHRYGPQDETPVAMADVLKEHIEQCPDHPMSELKRKMDYDIIMQHLSAPADTSQVARQALEESEVPSE